MTKNIIDQEERRLEALATARKLENLAGDLFGAIRDQEPCDWNWTRHLDKETTLTIRGRLNTILWYCSIGTDKVERTLRDLDKIIGQPTRSAGNPR